MNKLSYMQEAAESIGLNYRLAPRREKPHGLIHENSYMSVWFETEKEFLAAVEYNLKVQARLHEARLQVATKETEKSNPMAFVLTELDKYFN